MMANIAVVIGLTMGILIGLAYESWRCNCPGVARLMRVLSVGVKRIVVPDREGEVADRRRANFFGRGVCCFAADPGFELVSQQRGDSSAS